MRSHAALALLVFVGLGVTAAAPAANAPVSLRHLVYEVDYGITTSGERRTTGLTSGQNVAGNATATQHYGSSARNHGTLTLDVMAVSPEGALVVDVSLAGSDRSQAPIRVAILPDGQLGVDPKLSLSDEARRLLPLFASKVLAGRDIVGGATWSLALPQPLKGTNTYRVVATDGERAALTIDTELRVPGALAYEEHAQAKADYSVRLIDPLAYDVLATLRQTPDPERTETSTVHLTAKLVSDSFGSNATK